MGVSERQITRRDHVYFLAAVFCFWFAIYIYAPVFGVYLQEKGFNYSLIGVVLGSYGITQILLRFPLGILSDFLNNMRKRLLIGGFLMAFLSGLILVFFDSFWMVLLSRLLAGVTASMWVMATVLYSFYYRAEQSAKAMGTLQFVTVATQFLSMAISGYLVHLFNWNFLFWVGVGASLLGIYFVMHIKEVQLPKQEKEGLSIVEYGQKTIQLPQLKMLTFLSLIAHCVLFITIFGFSMIVASNLGVPEKSFIWLTCAFFIPHAIASLGLVFYEVGRRWNKGILAICFGVTAILLVFVPYAQTLFMLSILHVGIGLALGVIFPLLLSEVVRVSPTELKMSAMGFFQSFYALGIFLGPLVAGFIAEKLGLYEVFWFTGTLSLLAAVLVVWLVKQ